MKTKSWKTTVAGILTILGGVITIAIELLLGEPASLSDMMEEALAGIAMITGGTGLALARDNDKSSEAVGAGKKIGALVFFLLLPMDAIAATPARAVILSRTEVLETPKLDVDTGEPIRDESGAEIVWVEDVEVPELYLDLSVAFDFAVVDLATREYALGVVPGIGYGIKWAPEFWTLSPVLLAVDLFIQAGVVESAEELSGPDDLVIDLLPAVIVGDWIGVGVGPRFSMSLHEGRDDKVSAIFSFGIRKSL